MNAHAKLAATEARARDVLRRAEKQLAEFRASIAEPPPDPRIAIYYGTDPAAFVSACCERPRDDERLRVWVQACRKELELKSGAIGPTDWMEPIDDGVIQTWLADEDIVVIASTLSFSVRAAILRSCFPPPWLCGVKKCRACLGAGKHPTGRERDGRYTYTACNKCHGTGTIRTPPMIDPRWLRASNTPNMDASSVIDLAKDIVACCRHCNGKGSVRRLCDWCASTGKMPCPEPLKPIYDDGAEYSHPASCVCRGTGYAPPRFDRMAELADCLGDAGCDEPAITRHCASGGPFVVSDWLLSLILGDAK